MIVYVESNFVLELAKQQEQAVAAEKLLRMAESRKLKLTIPSISLFEPFYKVAAERLRRDEIVNTLKKEARELERAAGHSATAAAVRGLESDLPNVSRGEANLLDSVTDRVLRCVRIIQLDHKVFAKSRSLITSKSIHSSMDAIVLASVLLDAESQKDSGDALYMVNRNTRDFDTTEVKRELLGTNCKLISRYQSALDLIESTT